MSYQNILKLLETGEVRSANKIDGKWVANVEVKQSILEAFKAGELKEFSSHHFHGFVDKHTIPPRSFKPEDRIRMVPGGSSVRAGAYVAPGVIIMPPAYINIGAFVDEGTMVDSHALVGSCAQIGKRVHLSAAVQIGGVLEPIGMSPVIIEDDCFIGAGAVIVEGIQGNVLGIAAGIEVNGMGDIPCQEQHPYEITAFHCGISCGCICSGICSGISPMSSCGDSRISGIPLIMSFDSIAAATTPIAMS
jgi:2,3,4,5-tetrahydropyridine-2,6-dicarboxylate N-succinyltransferase